MQGWLRPFNTNVSVTSFEGSWINIHNVDLYPLFHVVQIWFDLDLTPESSISNQISMAFLTLITGLLFTQLEIKIWCLSLNWNWFHILYFSNLFICKKKKSKYRAATGGKAWSLPRFWELESGASMAALPAKNLPWRPCPNFIGSYQIQPKYITSRK